MTNKSNLLKNLIFTSVIFGVGLFAFQFYINSDTFDDSKAMSHQEKTSPEIGIADTKDTSSTGSLAKGGASAQQQSITPPYAINSIEDYEANSIYGPLPDAFSGSQPPKLSFDADGNLIVDGNVRTLFQYFFMRSNSEGREMALKRIEEYLAMSLPKPASTQALAILDDYSAYQTAAANAYQEYQQGYPGKNLKGIERLEYAMQKRKILRKEFLSEDVHQAFFEKDESYDFYKLETAKINLDDSLTQEEKRSRIVAIEQSLPPKMRKLERRKREEKELKTKIASLKSTEGNEDKIYELRKDFYGEKVANTFQFLESDSSSWTERVEKYNGQRKVIMQDDSLARFEKKQKLQVLANSTFSEKEKKKYIYQTVAGMGSVDMPKQGKPKAN